MAVPEGPSDERSAPAGTSTDGASESPLPTATGTLLAVVATTFLIGYPLLIEPTMSITAQSRA